MLDRQPQALQNSASSPALGEASTEGEDERGITNDIEIKARCISGADAPVFMQIRPQTGGALGTPVPLNTEWGAEFETSLFKGRIVTWAKGVASSPPDLFPGKKRRSWIVIQGSFKRKIPLARLRTGQRLKKAPIPGVRSGLRAWAKGLKTDLREKFFTLVGLLPRVQAGQSGDELFVHIPLVTSSQSIAVTAGEAEALAGIDSEPSDNLYLLGDEFRDRKTGAALSAAEQRKNLLRAFDKNSLIAETDPDHVYTFHIWQGLLDLETFRVRLGRRHNLLEHLHGQPLRIAAWYEVGPGQIEYLWESELWHKDHFK